MSKEVVLQVVKSLPDAAFVEDITAQVPTIPAASVQSYLYEMAGAGLLKASKQSRPGHRRRSCVFWVYDYQINKLPKPVILYQSKRAKAVPVPNTAPVATVQPDEDIMLLIPVGKTETMQVTQEQAKRIYQRLHTMFGGK